MNIEKFQIIHRAYLYIKEINKIQEGHPTWLVQVEGMKKVKMVIKT